MRRVASYLVRFGVAAMCAGLAGGGVVAGQQKRIEVSSGWVKAPAAGETTAAAFVDVDNPTMYDVYLMSAVTDVAGKVEFRDKSQKGDPQGQVRKTVTVPAYGSIDHGPERRPAAVDGSQAAAQGRRHGITHAENRWRCRASGIGRRAEGVAAPTEVDRGVEPDTFESRWDHPERLPADARLKLHRPGEAVDRRDLAEVAGAERADRSGEQRVVEHVEEVRAQRDRLAGDRHRLLQTDVGVLLPGRPQIGQRPRRIAEREGRRGGECRRR